MMRVNDEVEERWQAAWICLLLLFLFFFTAENDTQAQSRMLEVVKKKGDKIATRK